MITSVTPSSIACVQIPCRRTCIHGELAVPADARGFVVFVHATHGGWTDSRNWTVAWKLHQNGYATLLLDLLTPVEAALETAKGSLNLAVPILTERLLAAIAWARKDSRLADLPLACFASETGAAAALSAAEVLPEISTVIGRAARTDLIAEPVRNLNLPVLLVVGENDRRTQRWNREYAAYAPAKRRVKVINGATHRFMERGALCEVANASVEWLDLRLKVRRLSPEEAWVCC